MLFGVNKSGHPMAASKIMSSVTSEKLPHVKYAVNAFSLSLEFLSLHFSFTYIQTIWGHKIPISSSNVSNC